MRRFARAHPDLVVLVGLSALGGVVYLPQVAGFPHELRGDPQAVRLPFVLAAIGGGLLQYDWVRRLFGRAIGALAAVVLLTAPQYLLASGQLLADVPFVAAYSAGLGYLAVGLFTRRPQASSKRRWRARARTFLRCDWPFLAFWALEALALLARGLVGVALVGLVLGAYLVLTFRPRDYAGVIPPWTHAMRLLGRMRARWGVVLFCAVAAPWLVHVALRDGSPATGALLSWARAGSGTAAVGPGGGTFALLVRELGDGMFPWSAFLPLALWRFLGRASPTRSVAERRNALVLLAVILPWLSCVLRGTELAEDLLPLLPFASVLVAATLVWLGRGGEPWVRLREPPPALGPPVPPHVPEDVPWWQRHGAKGDLAVLAGVTLVAFIVLAHDVAIDVAGFVRLFVHAHAGAMAAVHEPLGPVEILFVPMGLAVGLWLSSRWVERWHLALVAVPAILLACWLSWTEPHAWLVSTESRPSTPATGP